MKLNYLIVFFIIFSCIHNLNAMLARSCRTLAQTTFKRALPVSSGFRTLQSFRGLSQTQNTSWRKKTQQRKQEENIPMSDDTDNTDDIKSSSQSSKSYEDPGYKLLEIIKKTGMTYEGEVTALLEYVHGLNGNGYTKFNNYIFELVVDRVINMQYVHPMLVSFVVLTQKDGFAKIIENIAKNIKNRSSETIFAAYKPLEILLQRTRTQTGYKPLKKWVCILPLEDFGKTFVKYFDNIPKNISPTCEENLLQLMYGTSTLLEALNAQDSSRHVEIATLKNDAMRYQSALNELRLAYDPHEAYGDAF